MQVYAGLIVSLMLSATVIAAEVPQQAVQQQTVQRQSVQNPVIDAQGFLETSRAALAHRQSHRVGESEFLKMMREPGTIVLDARSRELFDALHIDGAINLSFPDIAVESLKTVLPDRDARILIYCNNNFRNAELAFPTKLPSASMNLSTYSALYDYGYRNVYELGPNVDVNTTKLPLVATAK